MSHVVSNLITIKIDCPGGEIGRHKGLKIPRTKHPCRFDPGPGHQLQERCASIFFCFYALQNQILIMSHVVSNLITIKIDCPGGEIGRHKGLKIPRTKHPCRFDPGPGHQLQERCASIFFCFYALQNHFHAQSHLSAL